MINKMDILTKLNQKIVVEKLRVINEKKGSDSPLIIELDTTEVCDLACPGCVSQELMVTKKRFSNERLLKLGKEFFEAGVKGVILIGGGEPLAHPVIGDFIRYLGEHDIHIGITTNGTFIHRYLELIARYSFWTRISMDAATDKTYRKLRPAKGGGSKFDVVVNNMRALAKVKKGKLGYSYLIRTEADGFGIESNIHEIYPAAVLAKEIGCDYFEVKPSYQFYGGIDHALVKHDLQAMEEAKIQISRLTELQTDKFSIIKSINLDESLNGAQNLQPKEYVTCPATELRTLICPSGVFVCPYWRGKERFHVGDAHQQSLNELWHGARRKEVMKYLNPSKHCPFHCLRHESNVKVFEMIKAMNEGKSIEIVEEYDRFI